MIEDINSRLNDDVSEDNQDINEQIKGLENINFDDPEDYVDTISDDGNLIYF